MKVLTNRKVKSLFIQILLCILVFFIYSVIHVFLKQELQALYTLIGILAMGITVLVLCYRYFQEENKIMEDAVIQVREFISGDRNARIECDDEGELYRLFHEVNSLATILNAQAENEGKSRKFLQNTISDISHQLKTPLAALNIYNGIIQTGAETDDIPTVREFSGLSEQELDRIETLVQNLLKIAKFDAGTIVIEKNQENISEMMEDVKKQFAFRIGQEGKELVLSGNDSLSFFCDRNWVIEAVSNIVKNALDHTEEGDSVWVEWKRSASIIQITIKDNGKGIHQEDLHHIFKRFYRSRYSKDTQGIGLGLPLAKSVVETHGGTIEVDSRIGVGTTFVINFLA
ncbi:MAG: HAMP domain-containing histidine kinase [Lachnospiraceae bacterium]|nr:HAMP domain-containing histidine kinase [Lachnospiraceae bacterium]